MGLFSPHAPGKWLCSPATPGDGLCPLLCHEPNLFPYHAVNPFFPRHVGELLCVNVNELLKAFIYR